MWVKVDTAIQAATPARIIFDHVSSGALNTIQFGKNNTANQYFLYMTNNGGTPSSLIVSKTFTEGWHHIALSWGGSFPQIWFDGVLGGTAASNNIPSVLGTNFYVGSSTAGASQSDYPIDALRIYNRPLTAAEILQLYRAGR
jgi:hypothetical protein